MAEAGTDSVPPTVKVAVPPLPRVPLTDEGDVVNVMLAAPLVTEPFVVAIENARPASPATAKLSAELADPGKRVTSPEAVAAPAALTAIVPLVVPDVNLPKLSAADVVCVRTIGATTVAVAEPLALEVLAGAACAAPNGSTNATALRIVFLIFQPLPRTRIRDHRCATGCTRPDQRPTQWRCQELVKGWLSEKPYPGV